MIADMMTYYFKPVEFEQIGINFIDVNGKPTPEFTKLLEAVEHGKDHKTEDKLFNWIYEKATA
jgi:hypothetical protein